MKNKNLWMGLGLAAFSMTAQAQTTLVSLGFEDSDSKYTTEGALTPGGTFGDWVNKKDGDNWNEKSKEDKHSGEYAFLAENTEDVIGASWDRGFKIGNLQIKENTAYRLSFWLKVDEESYIDFDNDNKEKQTAVSAWMSQGIENYDRSFCSPAGASYGLDQKTIKDNKWHHYSFVTYFENSEVLNKDIEGKSWIGSAVFPEDKGGDGTKTYAEFYDKKLPNGFFGIINMFCPVKYTLDDVLIEEGVAFNAATFSEYGIKLDFGFPTNIASLAKANGGAIQLPTSCVSVKVGGQEVEIEFVEGQEDGFLYIFPTEEALEKFDEKAAVEVSFTPAADCPILYNADRRPSSDHESDMKVLGFTAETAYYDTEIVALPVSWSPAEMVSCVPENGSFELVASELKTYKVTYNKEISITHTSVTLTKNGISKDITDLKVDEDKASLLIGLPTLEDGEYKLTIYGMENTKGMQCNDDQVITFAVGIDNNQTQSKTIFNTDSVFNVTANGTFPIGWLSNDNGTVHQYGLTESGEVFNYNWGMNVGGGGCRSMTGYSGDLNGAAIYWRSMNGSNNLGTLTFGELVKDAIQKDGTLPEDFDMRQALYLEPNKYQITIRMCAWKNLNGNTDAVNEENAPKYTFKLRDLSGEEGEGHVFATFTDIKAMPNVNGKSDISVKNVTRSQADFSVAKAGYYMLEFSTTQPNGEYLMGGVDIITMPSKAAYYKGLLNNAVMAAKDSLEAANDELYNGTTKDALNAAIKAAQEGHFTSPSAIEAEIRKVQDAASALMTRKTNIDNFEGAVISAGLALDDIKDTKYENADGVADIKSLLDQYSSVKPETLTDEVLNEVSPKLVNASNKLAQVISNADILAWRAQRAAAAATLFGVEGSDVDAAANAVTDNTELINKVNGETAYKIVSAIASKTDLSDYKVAVYDNAVVDNDENVETNENGNPVIFKGIDLSCFINNAHLYRVNGDDGVPGWTITAGAEEDTKNIAFNTTPSADNAVVDAQIQIYGNANYDMSQKIAGLPAGKYAVVFQTRTPLVGPKTFEGDETEYTFYYNAQNDETQEWDKYIYAQVNDAEKQVAAYKGASGLTTTVIENIIVKSGDVLTLGAHERYVSGKAVKHEDNTPQDFWTGTTYVDYANLYLVSALDDYDYNADATGVETVNNEATIAEIYTAGGVKINGVKKGINIVKYSDGTVIKVNR